MISIHTVSCSRLAILTVSLHGEEPNSKFFILLPAKKQVSIT